MEDKENDIVKGNEIDLVSLARFIWGKRLTLSIASLVFFIFGLIIAFNSKVEFESSCKLLVESQDSDGSKLGSLGSLAGLAGINLSNSASNGFSPTLYPELINSTAFQKELINEPLYFERLDSTISGYTYFKDFNKPSLSENLFTYTIGLPFLIKSWITSEKKSEIESSRVNVVKNNLIRLSKKEWELIADYKDRISIDTDIETGIIEVIVEMPDAYAAAQLTELIVNKLTSKVTEYKIEKAKANLKFIEENFSEAEKIYNEKELKLAILNDKNQNIISSLSKTAYRKIENELNIAFEVYKGLATQLESAKLKVKEETPVFTVLEPARIPNEKSKPKRVIIVIFFILIGFSLSIFFIVLKKVKESVQR